MCKAKTTTATAEREEKIKAFFSSHCWGTTTITTRARMPTTTTATRTTAATAAAKNQYKLNEVQNEQRNKQ